jgi:hypothetical protein
VNQIDPSISYFSREKPLIQHWDDVKASKVDKFSFLSNICKENYLKHPQLQMVEDLIRPCK